MSGIATSLLMSLKGSVVVEPLNGHKGLKTTVSSHAQECGPVNSVAGAKVIPHSAHVEYDGRRFQRSTNCLKKILH